MSVAIAIERGRAIWQACMVRAVLVACSLGGCAFASGPSPSVDARPKPDAEVSIDAPMIDAPSLAPCAAPDPTGLVLCLELEDGVADGALADSSSAGRDAATTGLRAATRPVPAPSSAALVDPTSVTRVPQSAALELAGAYTMALWVRPDSLPDTGEVYGLLDHELQYAMLIGHITGQPVRTRCVNTGRADFEFTENLPAGAWSFLACTWDGVQQCAYRWSSAADRQRQCHNPPVGPAAAGAQGLAIGHLSDGGVPQFRLDGALDSIQLFSRALTADQLCAVIGQAAGCLP